MLVHAFAFNSCMQLLLLNGASVKQYTWTKTMGKLVVVHCERSMSLSRWEKFMQERSGTAGLETFFRDWAAGYAKHKSRIIPILRRRVVKHRLCAAGVSHCDSFYDAANAFPSVYQQVCNFALTIHVGRWIVLFSKIESLRQYRCSSHLCF